MKKAYKYKDSKQEKSRRERLLDTKEDCTIVSNIMSFSPPLFFNIKKACAHKKNYKTKKDHKKTSIIIPIFLLATTLLSSCTTLDAAGGVWPDQKTTHTKAPATILAPPDKGSAKDNNLLSHNNKEKASFQEFPAPTNQLQRKLLEQAKKLLGKNSVDVNGRHFNLDCTGVVLGIYYGAGIDLAAEFPKYTGNGVKRLYNIMRDHNLLYNTRYPQPGDLIFWDNTYDANGNGRFDDYLTHVGMVTEVRPDGTIIYIHHHLRKGIVLEQMNLNDPNTYTTEKDGKTIIVNSPMRRKGDPKTNGKWLASQLTRNFGQAYKYQPQK